MDLGNYSEWPKVAGAVIKAKRRTTLSVVWIVEGAKDRSINYCRMLWNSTIVPFW
jgi:hypothetical protein